MNTLGIAMVKNEADIVEAFVRHNMAFLDLLVVIDNDSTDGTREILAALQREGLPLLIFDDPIFGYFQSEKVTHVYRKVVPVYQPELVYLLDADEFIHAASREALEQALGQLAPGSLALLPWRTHVPRPNMDCQHLLQDPLGAMPGRRRQEEPTYYKAVIRRRPSDDATLVIEQGNHLAHVPGSPALPLAGINGAAVVHLPVRSVDQLSAKVINGWHAYLVKNRHREVPSMGFQWQQLYEQLMNGAGIAANTLCQTALDYAQRARADRSPECDVVLDPVAPRYGTLRYQHLASTGVLAKVARNMESYLRSDAEAHPTPVATGICRDLAPLRELVRQTDIRSIVALGDGQAWVAELLALTPALRAIHGDAADLLLAPLASHRDLAALAPQACGLAHQRVVTWSEAGSSPALHDALVAWYAQGWEPQLMQTMGYRALASYASQRHGAIVFQRADPAQSGRAEMLRELLCALEAQPSTWTDPAADCIRHPMQDMQLNLMPA